VENGWRRWIKWLRYCLAIRRIFCVETLLKEPPMHCDCLAWFMHWRCRVAIETLCLMLQATSAWINFLVSLSFNINYSDLNVVGWWSMWSACMSTIELQAKSRLAAQMQGPSWSHYWQQGKHCLSVCYLQYMSLGHQDGSACIILNELPNSFDTNLFICTVNHRGGRKRWQHPQLIWRGVAESKKSSLLIIY